MSGHSKWANIKVRKGAQDAKRGKIFTRHAKLIEIAAREGGGGDPEINARLRTAIENAKAEAVPNANIERAIKKGTGALKGAERMEAVLYEAYGPEGTAYLIECLTENKNRTVSNVKLILNKNGGRFAESGSVGWMFEQKGVVIGRRSAPADDNLELALIDAGAEAVDKEDQMLHITTGREDWNAVRDLLKQEGYEIETAGLKFIPSQDVRIDDAATAKAVLRLMEALEEDDDVNEVHTNAEISESLVAEIAA